jgi:hypothetical protein
MTAKDVLEQILLELPENSLDEVLDFAKFLSAKQEDREEWRQFGQSRLSRAYGDDEPEYTEADMKP